MANQSNPWVETLYTTLLQWQLRRHQECVMERYREYTNRLFEAVERNDIEGVQDWIAKYNNDRKNAIKMSQPRLLANNEKPMSTDDRQFLSLLEMSHKESLCLQSLHLAAAKGYPNIAKYLLGECGSLEEIVKAKQEALFFAAREAYYEIVCWMRANGHDLNQMVLPEDPAHFVNEIYVLDWIFSGKAPIDQNDVTFPQNSPFDIEKEHLAVIRLLLDPPKQDLDPSLLQNLSADGKKKINALGMLLFKSQYESALKQCTGHALHIAVEKNNFELVQWLCTVNDYKPYELQTYPARQSWNAFGQINCYQRRISRTAIEIAAERGYFVIFDWILNQFPPEKLNIGFLERSLCLAATHGHFNIVECLIKFGVNPSTTTRDYPLPLHCAASNNHLKIVEFLVRLGADINVVDKEGAAALHLACSNTDIVNFLCEAGANVNIKTLEGKTPIQYVLFDISYCEDAKKRVSILNGYGARYSLSSGLQWLNWFEEHNLQTFRQFLIENPSVLVDESGLPDTYMSEQFEALAIKNIELKRILKARMQLTELYHSLKHGNNRTHELIGSFSAYSSLHWDLVKSDFDLLIKGRHPLFDNSREILNKIVISIIGFKYVGTSVGLKKLTGYLAKAYQDEYFYITSTTKNSAIKNIIISTLLLLRYEHTIDDPIMALNLSILVGHLIGGKAQGLDINTLIANHSEELIAAVEQLSQFCVDTGIFPNDFYQPNTFNVLLHKILIYRANSHSLANAIENAHKADEDDNQTNTQSIALTSDSVYLSNEYEVFQHKKTNLNKIIALSQREWSKIVVDSSAFQRGALYTAKIIASCINKKKNRFFSLVPSFEYLKTLAHDKNDIKRSINLAKCILLNNQKCLLDTGGFINEENFKILSNAFRKNADIQSLLAGRYLITKIYLSLFHKQYKKEQLLSDLFKCIDKCQILLYSDMDDFFDGTHDWLEQCDSLPHQFYRWLLSVDTFSLYSPIKKLLHYIAIKYYQNSRIDGNDVSKLNLAGIFLLRGGINFADQLHYRIFRNLVSTRTNLFNGSKDLTSLLSNYQQTVSEIMIELTLILKNFLGDNLQDEYSESPFLEFEVSFWKVVLIKTTPCVSNDSDYPRHFSQVRLCPHEKECDSDNEDPKPSLGL